ncbi:hypothetical protein MNBD_BACTEROID07-1288 [hydrothermal vent metagenome]|uniref:Uncharacterized protein n=1 Tax=hydrothermal vent metagenome TaxID=652676 RepID=A0A3B0UQ35_9ZZZZ
MEDQDLTPEKSFELISQVINEAKLRFEENGFIYVLWGLLGTVAAFGQFFLLKNGYNSINYNPYFLMPLGAVYTGYYYYKKGRVRKNQISRMVSFSWTAVVLNILILGFLLAGVLKQNLIPVILILVGIGTIVSASAIKNRLILYSGVVINFAGLACFRLEWIYQPLLLGIVFAIAILIPGIILMVEHKRRQNV